MNNPPPPPGQTPGTPPALNLKAPRKSRASLKMKESLKLAKATRSAPLTSALIKFDNWIANVSELRDSVVSHHTLVKQSNARKVAMYKKLGEVYLNNGISVKDGVSSENPISIMLHKVKEGIISLIMEPEVPKGGTALPVPQPNTAPFLMSKFSEHCIAYLTNYINHVSGLRVAWSKIDLLRREYDHYQKKVDELHSKHLKKQQKAGTNMDEDGKLVRNRQKLETAMNTYTKASENLCKAVDDVVDTGWKEIQSFALKVFQFERMYSGTFSQRVVDAVNPGEVHLAKVGSEHFLKSDPNFTRIDEIFEVVSRSFVEVEGGGGGVGAGVGVRVSEGSVDSTSATGNAGGIGGEGAQTNGNNVSVPVSGGVGTPTQKKKKGWGLGWGSKKKSSDEDASPQVTPTVQDGTVGGSGEEVMFKKENKKNFAVSEQAWTDFGSTGGGGDGFANFSGAQAAAPAPPAAAAQQSVSNDGNVGFANFSTAPAATPAPAAEPVQQAVSNSGFATFSAAQEAAPVPAAAPAKQSMSNNDNAGFANFGNSPISASSMAAAAAVANTTTTTNTTSTIKTASKSNEDANGGGFANFGDSAAPSGDGFGNFGNSPTPGFYDFSTPPTNTPSSFPSSSNHTISSIPPPSPLPSSAFPQPPTAYNSINNPSVSQPSTPAPSKPPPPPAISPNTTPRNSLEITQTSTILHSNFKDVDGQGNPHENIGGEGGGRKENAKNPFDDFDDVGVCGDLGGGKGPDFDDPFAGM